VAKYVFLVFLIIPIALPSFYDRFAAGTVTAAKPLGAAGALLMRRSALRSSFARYSTKRGQRLSCCTPWLCRF
jgi:hypothetical protein